MFVSMHFHSFGAYNWSKAEEGGRMIMLLNAVLELIELDILWSGTDRVEE